MKIVSVNRDQTPHLGQVAFNLDEELPPQVRAKLAYERFTLRGEGRVLIVIKDMRNSEPIGPDTVENINARIASIVAEFDEQDAQRERMLQQIAADAGLPLE